MPNVSLATFARYVTDAADGFRAAKRQGLTNAGRRIAARARSYIGRYQTSAIGPFEPWEPLSQNTLHGGYTPQGLYYPGKIELGYAPPDNPLLRTGELRESIGYSVKPNAVEVGSPLLVALWQEMGTAPSEKHWGIPPRSFLGRAMAELGDDEVRRIGGQVFWPLLRKSVR